MFMPEQFAASLAGLPAFFAYFGASVAMLIVFVTVYIRLTPHHEFALIKSNNGAAAIAFGGAFLGFILPLASAMANSVNLFDFLLWGAVAFVVQVLAYFANRFVIRDLPARISAGETAAGAFAGIVSLGVGMLNAASMTY
jgi:putative membrane protein